MVMSLKKRLKARSPLVGTFLKTPSSMICEVLGRSGLDLVCIDAEHSPFDRRDIDACVHALTHAGMPSLVRIQANSPEHILNALDCGATGILAPHVISKVDASELVANSHYGAGRGYAGSTRAAGYGARSMSEHKRLSADTTVVVAQIEDAQAMDNLDDLFATPGIDAFFIGRADLSVSLGADGPNDPKVIAAVEEICRRGQEAGACVGMFTGDLSEISKWQATGATFFLLSSDHALLLNGAEQMSRTVRDQF
jgi:staphyloferrin B biosynthesis citrate synthase